MTELRKLVVGWVLFGLVVGACWGFALGIVWDKARTDPACALQVTAQDVGWKDAHGVTHDSMPLCNR